MTDDDLELALAGLADHLAWPETPDLATAVRRRLAGQPAPVDLAGRVRARIDGVAVRRRRQGWRAAAVLAVVVVLAATLAALPGPRRAIADLFGIGGVRITQGGEGGGGAPPPATSTPSRGGAGEGLALGERVPAAEAASGTGRPVPVPARLGRPDAVWLDRSIPGGAVSVVYRPRRDLPVSGQTGVGAVLTAFPGVLEQEILLKKLVGGGARATRVQVGTATGLWIEGAPHYLFYVAPDGSMRDATGRLAGNTLLWERDGLTMRLEAEVDQATAVAIATSLP